MDLSSNSTSISHGIQSHIHKSITLLFFQMYSEMSSNKTLQKVKAVMESSREDHLGKAVALAWKFVTLPNPLIVCQPKGLTPGFMSQRLAAG